MTSLLPFLSFSSVILFLLSVFKIFRFITTFQQSDLRVFFFIFILLFFSRDFWICGLLSFIKFRKFLLITASNISYGSLPTSGTPSKNMLDHLLLSHLLVVLPLFLFSPFVSVWIISMDLSIG